MVKLVRIKSGAEDINQEDMFFKLLVLAHDITIRFPKVAVRYEFNYDFESPSGYIGISTPWKLHYQIKTVDPNSPNVMYIVENQEREYKDRYIEHKEYLFDRLVKLFLKDFSIKYSKWFKD